MNETSRRTNRNLEEAKKKEALHSKAIRNVWGVIAAAAFFSLSGLTGLAAIAVSGCGAGGADASGGGGGNVGTSGAQDVGLFRQLLAEGYIPGEETLDPNGFFSEHYTQLPPPECGETICLQPMLAVHHDWVRGHYQAALQIGFNTTIDPSTLERPPLDVIVAIDTSGSMAGDKLAYAQDGLDLLIDELHPEDRLGLVAYSSEVTVITELHSVQDATALHDAVGELIAQGSTNFHDGLQTALQMSANAATDGRESRVIMLSDGNPTTGIIHTDQILEMADAYIADGIGVTTIGMGLDFNIELMKGLAEKGAGTFYFLEDPSAITEVFTQELDYFVTPIAYDVNVEVRSGAGYTLGEVVGTSFWTTESYGGELSIPTLFLASRVSAEDPDPGRRGGGSSFFVQMVPRTELGGVEDLNLVAEVTLTYRLPGTTELLEQTIRVQNPGDPGAEVENPYYTHQAIEKNYAVYNVYLGLREACRLAEESHDYSLWVLERLEETTRRWNEERNDEDIAADLELIAQFKANLEAKGATPVEPGTIDEQHYYGNDVVVQPFGCSAAPAGSGSSLGWILLLVCGLLVAGSLRRRQNG